MTEAQSCLADISYHYNRLNRLLAPNDLTLHRIKPDGDCIFNAVIFLIENANPQISVEGLRRIVADHMLEYSDEYSPFVHLNPATSYKDAVIKIRAPGEWNTALCDAVPLALCNILNETMVIYSSQYGNSLMTVNPTLARTHGFANPVPALNIAHLAIENCERYDAVVLSKQVAMTIKIPVIGPEYLHLLWDESSSIPEVELIRCAAEYEANSDVSSIVKYIHFIQIAVVKLP
jgi:hypothetical protein